MEQRDDELARAKRAAGNRVLLAFASLVLVPIAPLVLVSAIRALGRERALGLRSSSTPTAIAFSGFATLYGATVIAIVSWSIWAITHRPPEVVIANGDDEATLEIALDGRAIATLAPGGHHTERVDVGEHELCAVRAPDRAPIGCSRRAFAQGDAALWNPGSEARFLEASGPSDPEWHPLPRAEWIDLARYRRVLDEADPFDLGIGAEIVWGRSEPVTIVVDNPYDQPITVRVDDRPPLEIPATHWQELAVREGSHHVAVLAGEQTLFDRTLQTADHGAYLLDPGAESDYQVCRERPELGYQVTSEPVPRAEWHDASELDHVLEAETPRSELRTRDAAAWITWIETPCED